jgi:hypothetical protein
MRCSTAIASRLLAKSDKAAAVSRLEHALLNIGAERLSYGNRLGDAKRRLASYRPHLGEGFALGAELAPERNELGLVEQVSLDKSKLFVTTIAIAS